LFVIIDRVGVPSGLGKLTNGAFFNVITDRGRFYPEYTAIKINHRPHPPARPRICGPPVPMETYNYTWNLARVLLQSGAHMAMLALCLALQILFDPVGGAWSNTATAGWTCMRTRRLAVWHRGGIWQEDGMSMDRFGNAYAPGLPYARGQIL